MTTIFASTLMLDKSLSPVKGGNFVEEVGGGASTNMCLHLDTKQGPEIWKKVQ